MKSKQRINLFAMLLMSVLAIFLGVTDVSAYGISTAATTTFPAGGGAVVDVPTDTDGITAVSPDLLRKAIDERITVMRQMDTPLDQLSRLASRNKNYNSWAYDYYSVDERPDQTTLSIAYVQPTSGFTASHQTVALTVVQNTTFSQMDTITIPGVKGYKDDGVTLSNIDLMLYVVSKNDQGVITVRAANGPKLGSIANCVPSLSAGVAMVRMGRAASEVDVQTAQFQSEPTPSTQYHQRFVMQIEQSKLSQIHEKNVDWNLSDKEELAVYEMKRGMEKSYLMGVKAKTIDVNNKTVYLTGGIYWQAGNDVTYGSAVTTQISEDEFVDITKAVFVGNSANKRKVMFVGSDILANLAKMKSNKHKTEIVEKVIWGLKFKSMQTQFGEFLVFHHPEFDKLNRAGHALILDEEFITKAYMRNWTVTNRDMKDLAVRDTDAVFIEEVSSLYLQYPKAHTRLYPYSKTA